ncbi:MAG: MFS transporter [Kiritimatiellaeota bacterium]|nr:MFS transporter [Kiritimatiellota bacterium]
MQDITNVQKIRAFPWYYSGQAANIVFVLLSWFGPILPLFLDALGLTKTQIGLILAIPFFCTPVSLLVSRWIQRRGVKKMFLWSLGLRTLVTGGLCAAPALLLWAGVPVVFIWVVAVSLVFSMCRVIGETGMLSWAREFIPNRLRGRTDATNAIISGMVSLLTSLLAAVILKYITGLHGYILLVLLSLPFGLGSLFLLALVPGGKPVQVEVDRHSVAHDYLQVLKDRNFLTYEVGQSLFILASSAFAFLPLFMQGQIGLSVDKVLMLSACFWSGILASGYLWGWSADRFGSKPVMLTGLLLVIFMPLWLFLMPSASVWSMSVAIMTYVYFGIAIQGWGAGANRYYYVDVIPANNYNQAYYPIHFTLCGLSAAFGPLLAGALLDYFRPLSANWRFIHVNQFSPLFGVSLLLFIGALYGLRRLRKDDSVQPGKFMSMFIQGNPLLAFNSMIRYRFADDEWDRLSTTRHMGDAESPLSVAELLEAITDPSFNVRYEAILAIARMPSQAQLTDALIHILDSKEPDLCVAAGWALGRIGDRRAVPALRRALASEYALLRSRSARSLANMGDAEAAPILLNLFRTERHNGIRVAYASALGVFRVGQALDDLLVLLDRLPDDNLRSEVTLAIVRIMGGENHFVHLWRMTRSDFGTGVAEAMAAMRNHLSSDLLSHLGIGEALDAVEQTMGGQNIPAGAAALGRLIRQMPLDRLEANQRTVLEACASRLANTGTGRIDYILILLALNGLHVALVILRRQQEREKKDDAEQMVDDR